jgi:hypothetical protein
MVISREDGMPASGPVDTWPVAIAGDDRHEDEDVLTLDTPLFDPSNASLADWLASARDIADSAAEANARGHAALYQAIGRAWGFAIAAQSAPADYQDLLDEAGISLSNRSPMTPVVKLVFGANHDKTRLAEYAAVLSHAAQKQIEADRLASYLAAYQGGLKALLKDIRRSGRASSAETATTLDPEAVLRAAQIIGGVDMSNDADDSEFIVLIARREIAGTLSVVAQLPKSEALTSKALKLAAKGLCV